MSLHINIVKHRGQARNRGPQREQRGALAASLTPGEKCPHCGRRLVKTMSLGLHLSQVKRCRDKQASEHGYGSLVEVMS